MKHKTISRGNCGQVKSIGEALHEFIKIVSDIEVEKRGIGEAWRVQYKTEILLCNALNWVTYDEHCKQVSLATKYPWLTKLPKN